MSVVPVSVSMPSTPTAITRVIPSWRRRSCRNRLIRVPVPGWGSLPQGVPEDDVVNEPPFLPSLVRVDVHGDLDVQERALRRVLRRVLEDVVVRPVVGDGDGGAAAPRPPELPA